MALKAGCRDYWTWDGSRPIQDLRLIDPENRKILFHPNWSNGTVGIRGTKELNGGRYYWEIETTDRVFGTSMMFGIGTKKARLHTNGFSNLLGEDEYSWGLSHKGLLWHGGRHESYTESFKENVATTVGLYFDGMKGTLTYYKDGNCLGVAFKNLEKIEEALFPMVSSSAAKTEMALGVQRREFQSLQDRCRDAILARLTHKKQIDELTLPHTLKRYLQEETVQEGDLALGIRRLTL